MLLAKRERRGQTLQGSYGFSCGEKAIVNIIYARKADGIAQRGSKNEAAIISWRVFAANPVCAMSVAAAAEQ